MQTRRFVQCDVFTAVPSKGNGLAVVLDGEGLSDERMQAFAAWTNLAETTFLLPSSEPRADYKLRIFTPTREMPFAGHPTLGSCAAWLDAGGVPKEAGLVRQDCAVGLVEIDLTGQVPAFAAPPTKVDALPEQNLEAIATALEIPRAAILRTARLDNGPVWQALELDSAERVLGLESGRVRWPDFKAIGLIGAHPAGAACRYEVRMLAPSSGMSEDPITGSLNAALAHWLAEQGRLDEAFVVAQGTRIGREGRVYVRPAGGADQRVLIGGETQIMIRGELTF